MVVRISDAPFFRAIFDSFVFTPPPLSRGGENWGGGFPKTFTCLNQLIVFIGIKYISSSPTKTSLVNYWPVFLYPFDKNAFILILLIRCDIKLYMTHIQTRHTDLLPLKSWGRSWQGWSSCDWNYHYQFIDYMKDHTKSILLVVLFVSPVHWSSKYVLVEIYF